MNNNEIEQNIGKQPVAEEIKVVSDVRRLKDFDDLSGISITQLNKGLWWAQNNKFIKRTIFWLLLILGLLGWLYSIFSFVYYIGFGMNKDNAFLQEMVLGGAIDHNRLVANSPVDLQLSDLQQIFASAENKYDFASRIRNPNTNFYANFDYHFLFDGTSTPVRRGFVLPNEEKYLLELGYASGQMPSSAQLKIENFAWQRLDKHVVADWPSFKQSHLDIDISEPKFLSAKNSGLSEKININLISFTINNRTPFNYYRLPLNIYLYAYDQLVGVMETTAEQLSSGEIRNLQINFPGQVDRVDRVDVVPTINIISNDIYFKFKGVTGPAGSQ
jgi:hypothetical protein